jgi:SHS2 domain-containing protein
MKKFEILEHPAELRLRIYGKTLEELFYNAALAMAQIQNKNIALYRRSSTKCYKEKIKIQSPDINSLLVDFLSEILAKSQINKQVYKVIKLKVYKEKSRLEGEIAGAPIKRFNKDIKAVTYQDVNIQLKPKSYKLKAKLWQTDLVLDI